MLWFFCNHDLSDKMTWNPQFRSLNIYIHSNDTFFYCNFFRGTAGGCFLKCRSIYVVSRAPCYLHQCKSLVYTAIFSVINCHSQAIQSISHEGRRYNDRNASVQVRFIHLYIFINTFKHVIFMPLIKKSNLNSSDLSNYRPISTPPPLFIDKIQETL